MSLNGSDASRSVVEEEEEDGDAGEVTSSKESDSIDDDEPLEIPEDEDEEKEKEPTISHFCSILLSVLQITLCVFLQFSINHT